MNSLNSPSHSERLLLPHFTDKETQAERLSDSSWATQLVLGTARVGMQSGPGDLMGEGSSLPSPCTLSHA